MLADCLTALCFSYPLDNPEASSEYHEHDKQPPLAEDGGRHKQRKEYQRYP
jgi:hypothetical protein